MSTAHLVMCPELWIPLPPLTYRAGVSLGGSILTGHHHLEALFLPRVQGVSIPKAVLTVVVVTLVCGV